MTGLRRTATLGQLLASLLVVLVGAGALCLVVRGAVDRIGDRADRALAKATQVDVRVSGLDVQVKAAVAEAQGLADRIQAGLALDVSGLRSAVDALVGAVESAPGLAAQASMEAAAQLAALLDAAKGIVADLGRAVAPVGALSRGVPVSVSARVDVHVLQPLVADLLGLLPQVLSYTGGPK